MKFEPVSEVPYLRLNPTGQILVCTNMASAEAAKSAWTDRAAAAFSFDWKDPLDAIVRDILANPQIRAVVIMDVEPHLRGPGARVLHDFWASKHPRPDWKIPTAHLNLVRQFVDLYDGDCGLHGPLHPFWPERITYKEIT